MLLSVLSELTDAITTAIGNYGLYAVFVLMLIDAVFPAASEVVMVYGGAIASGAIAGTSVNLFGYTFEPGLPAYLAIAIAGTVGYLIGADDRLGDRPPRRAAVPRETRALAPPRPREARARRGVVPALGGLGGVRSAASRPSCDRSSRSRPASSRLRSGATRC